MQHAQRNAVLVLVAGVLGFGAGCSSGSRIAAENDRLRLEVMEQQAKIADLEGRNRELESKLTLATESQPQPGADPEVIANTPVVTGISLGKLSHAADANHDGAVEKLVLYVQPSDGLGRFMQMVGTIAVTAATLPVDGPAETISQGRFSPTEVRDAYRSGMTGTHYTFEVPIRTPMTAAGGSEAAATVRVEFTDGLTGQVHFAEKSISLRVVP